MRQKATKSRRGGWRQTNPEPAKIGPLLRECGFLGDDADPLEVTAHFDRQNRPRRIHATYPNGWKATLNLRVDGSFALSQSVRFVSKKVEA